MNAAGQIFFDFPGVEGKSVQSKDNKARISYGGGFHVPKRPAPPPAKYQPETSQPEEIAKRFSAEDGVPAIHVIERELERLKMQSRNLEQMRSHQFAEGILHLDPPSHREQQRERIIEDFSGKGMSFEELEVLKERNAEKIIEIEAEIRRKRTEESQYKAEEYVPVYRREKTPKKASKLTGYQKDYYEKFEKFVYSKEKAREDKIIENRIQESVSLKKVSNKKGIKQFEHSPAARLEPPKPRQSILRTSSSSKLLKYDKEKEKDQPICLVPYKHMAKLEAIFLELDTHQDLVVSRKDLIENMLESESIIKILHIDAVRVAAHQVLDLESMLLYIKSDVEAGDDMITWNQFLDYFFVTPSFEESKFEGMENPRLYDIDLPNRHVALIQEVFEDLDKKTHNKVSTFEFINAVRRDTKTSNILKYTARIPEGLSHIPEETVSDVLERMQETAESLVSWADVLGFFSKRGLPKDSNIGEALITKNTFVRAKMPPKAIKENFVQTEDLEPKKHSHRSRSTSPRQRVTFYENTITKNVTIPEPFLFEERNLSKPMSIREKWLEKEELEREEELQKHLKFQYKARDVPREVSHPKYEGLQRALQERSNKVKEESYARTRELEKPFNFYLRGKEKVKKPPSPPPEYKFKANPIPWACTVPLYESKMQDDRAIREERKSSAAQEYLRKASLPPRMEMHEKLKKSEPVKEKTPSPRFKVKEPPNFEKLHKKFELTLEAKKKAKMTTHCEPFLIDKRVEENNKKKEEKRKKKEEEKAKIREEEDKKRRENEEKMRAERVRAKQNWKTEHDSLKPKAMSKKSRSSSRSLSRGSTPDYNRFTAKDLSKDSVSMNSLKASPAKSGAGKIGNKANPLAPSSNNAKTGQAAKKGPASSQGLAPPSQKPGDFTEKDLAGPEEKKINTSGKPSQFPALGKGSDKNSLAPSKSSSQNLSKNTQSGEKKDQKSVSAAKEKSNPLAPSEKQNPLTPSEKSKQLTPSEKSKPLTPSEKSNPLAPSEKSNPLAPSEKSNPLAPLESSLPQSRYQDLQPIPEEHALSPPNPAQKTSNSKTFQSKTQEEAKKDRKYNTLDQLKTNVHASEKISAADKDSINEKLQSRKREAKKQEIEYKEKIKTMQENVSKRPLLVESATDASSKNRSKMKILLQIKKNLEDSGVKYEPYFTEEELLLIQEAEYMNKMHRLK